MPPLASAWLPLYPPLLTDATASGLRGVPPELIAAILAPPASTIHAVPAPSITIGPGLLMPPLVFGIVVARVAVGDGIARIHGLENVMAGELIEFPHNVARLAVGVAPVKSVENR